CTGPEELSVCRIGFRRRARGGNLHPDRHGQAQRPRSGSLSPRGADPHRRPPHLSHQRTAPLEHHLRCRSVHITCSWTLSKTVTSVRLLFFALPQKRIISSRTTGRPSRPPDVA